MEENASPDIGGRPRPSRDQSGQPMRPGQLSGRSHSNNERMLISDPKTIEGLSRRLRRTTTTSTRSLG